ncbi:MAG TPA: cytochrome c oxidase assembly protein [Longimicrobiales bacterium]
MIALLHGVTEFSWTQWPIHPSTAIGCALVLGAYYMGIGPLRRKYQWADRVETWQPICFTTAILILFGALNGPLHELSDLFLFSAHMVQHLIMTLIMAPLMLVGVPDWLWRALIRNTVGFGAARVLTSPLVAFAIYNIVFAGWHFPMFYNWALEDHNVHIVQHIMFIIAAMFMWWPVVEPLPELSRLITPMRMVYLFAISIPMSLISALITLSEEILYTWYGDAERIFNLSVLEDQQLGGLIMWVPGALIFWVAISILFYRWAKAANREEEVARELLRRERTNSDQLTATS